MLIQRMLNETYLSFWSASSQNISTFSTKKSTNSTNFFEKKVLIFHFFKIYFPVFFSHFRASNMSVERMFDHDWLLVDILAFAPACFLTVAKQGLSKTLNR